MRVCIKYLSVCTLSTPRGSLSGVGNYGMGWGSSLHGRNVGVTQPDSPWISPGFLRGFIHPASTAALVG